MGRSTSEKRLLAPGHAGRNAVFVAITTALGAAYRLGGPAAAALSIEVPRGTNVAPAIGDPVPAPERIQTPELWRNP